VIAINLLPGAKKRKRGGAAFQMPDVKALAASVKDPWLLACVGVWTALAVVVLFLFLPRRGEIQALEPELETTKQEAARLRQVLRQKAETEARRDSLLAQIEVIRTIDRERYTWPHILDAVAKALPPYTWLDDLSTRQVEGEIAESQVAFQLTGKSADIQAITRFVRNLEESPFLEGATTVSTGIVNEQGREVFTFVLNARYQQPDTTLLTMQPLAASLVQGFRSGVRTRR
jgi:Tfp pilus assembly protein PilN